MPSTLRTAAHLTLAALLLCVSGAPVEDTPTDSPAGDTSGEGETTFSDPASSSSLKKIIIDISDDHAKELHEEFPGQMTFTMLEDDQRFPTKCPRSRLGKACLRRAVEGLQTYRVLLKFVRKVYPNSVAALQAASSVDHVINLIKANMRRPEQIQVLSQSQEEQLLKDLDQPDLFLRKKTAHSILRKYCNFAWDSIIPFKTLLQEVQPSTTLRITKTEK